MSRIKGGRAAARPRRTEISAEADESGLRQTNSWIMMVIVLIAVVMLFVGLSSAYLARSEQRDWMSSPLPSALWLSTAVILISSLTMERARRRAAKGDWHAGRAWLNVTTLLGVLFVISQLAAWRQLTAAGVFLQTNPHSSFFYVLTLVHGLHVLGGMIALVYTRYKVGRLRPRLEVAGRPAGGKGREAADRFGDGAAVNSVALAAVYWHFLGGLWLYLFALLYAL